jgi:hypothetical protein
MLSGFKEKHLRRILWGLILIIVPSFSFFGAMYYIQNRTQGSVGTIGKRRISGQDFNRYLRMAELSYAISEMGKRQTQKNDYNTHAQKAWEYLMLVWKADQEKIKADDAETADFIQKMFFGNKPFNRDQYDRIVTRGLRFEVTEFEQCVRDFVRIGKLYKKYLKPQISENEVQELYRRQNKKLKLSYLTFTAEKDATAFIKGLSISSPDMNFSANAKINNLEPKKSDYFNSFEMMSQLKLEPDTLDKIMTLEKSQVVSKPLPVSDGSWMVAQVIDIKDFDADEYAKTKDIYRMYLENQKMFVEELKFLSKLEKEADIKYFDPGATGLPAPKTSAATSGKK